MTIASSLGGCDFVADPKLGWRTAHAFWLPRIAADVVSFVPSPLTLSSNIFVDNLQRFAVVERAADDGRHVLWDDGTQLWVAGDVQPDRALVAVLPFDGAARRRTIAATHVRNRIAGITSAQAPSESRQAVDRAVLRLRALDALNTGSTRREIAVALFGAARVPAGTA